MEREELLKKLREMHAIDDNDLSQDEEVNHLIADQLILQYIDDVEITDAFELIDRWYA